MVWEGGEAATPREEEKRAAAEFRGSGRRRNPRKLGTHRCAVTAIYPLPRRSTTVRNTDLICLQRMADHSSLPATNAHPPQSPQSQTSPARTTPQPAGAPTGKGHGGDTSGRTGPIRASKLAGLTRSVLAAWFAAWVPAAFLRGEAGAEGQNYARLAAAFQHATRSLTRCEERGPLHGLSRELRCGGGGRVDAFLWCRLGAPSILSCAGVGRCFRGGQPIPGLC